MKRIWFLIILSAFLVSVASPDLHAQTELNLRRVTNLWPTIELYFTASCQGQEDFNLTKQNFRVRENGIEVPDFTLSCPDPSQRCAISVALVFDASGSMAGAGNAGAKAAGHAFVDLMDGTIDEAAFLWFNSVVTLQQPMTIDKTDLNTAIDALPASGATAVWDGIMAGLQEIISSGNNTCQAVIAMTDGQDGSSRWTPDEIIAFATRNHIRVFTIGLGSVTPALLETIALFTGGRYYQTPSASQLPSLYQEIADVIYGSFHECMITYESECKDGTRRDVELTLQNTCDGPVAKNRSYRAPLDSSTFTPIDFAIGTGSTGPGGEVVIPLELQTATSVYLQQCSFIVTFPQDELQFKEIATPPGSLLEGIPIDAEYVGSGIRIYVKERAFINGPGLLAELTFKAADLEDTTHSVIDLSYWAFESGCSQPVLHDGSVDILPVGPRVNGQVQMPQELTWIKAAGDYSPNPFNIKATVINTGDVVARDVRFILLYDPADLLLLSPSSYIQPGQPEDIEPNGLSVGEWMVRAKPRIFGDSIHIGIRVVFDNHSDITMMMKIWVPPVSAKLMCDLQPIKLTVDWENQKYVPMPFTLTVPVWNTATDTARGIEATVFFEPDLTLAGSDQPTKQLTPSTLAPGDSGRVEWTFTHPISLVDTIYTVNVMLVEEDGDTSWCQTTIEVPGISYPSLRMTCTSPDALVFDENIGTAGEYVPNPFQVSVSVVNLGMDPTDNVTVFIYLPDGVEFDPPGQWQRQSFDGPLDHWQIGDPYPTATWTLRYTKRFRHDTTLEFKWAAGGIAHSSGLPTDSVYSWCETDIPKVLPVYECSLTAPDTLHVNSSGGLEPNPFDVVYTINNTGHNTGSIKRLVCYFPSDGIALQSHPDNTQIRNGDWSLDPGDTATFTWTFDVEGRVDPRSPQIQVVAFDDEGNPVLCETTMYLEPVTSSLRCNMTVAPNVLSYNESIEAYGDTLITVTAQVTHTGFDLTNLSVEISLHDYEPLMELDPNGPDNTNPKTIPELRSGETATFEWQYHLARPNTTGSVQVAEFCMSIRADQQPIIDNACCSLVEIEPVSTTAIDDKPLVPDFSLGRNYPNPFSSITDIPYALGRDAEVSITVHNVLGQQVAELVRGRVQAGRHSARFNGQDLPGGVYIIRMNAEGHTMNNVMLLQR